MVAMCSMGLKPSFEYAHVSLMKEIHAHEVLEWIAAESEGKTPREIADWAEASFGPEATFYTCSRMGMDINELVEFFVSAQKVVTDEKGALRINRQRMCSH